MKDCTMFATITANGFIADDEGNEDIFSDDNWNLFVDLAIKHKNIIWGRKTYEMVCSWGADYIDCFDTIKIVVISKSDMKFTKSNVIVCKDENEAIQKLNDNNIEIPFIGGGASIYSLFLKTDLISKVILSYNSLFLSNGTSLINEDMGLKKYRINNSFLVNENILCIEMEK